MNWRDIAAPSALLAMMLLAGTVLAEEGRNPQAEVADDVVKENVTDTEPWVIAPNPTEAVGGEEIDEASVEVTERERSSEDAEGQTGYSPEDDTTIGIDDSDAKGDPLIAPAGDQENAGAGNWKPSHTYILIAALVGIAAIGVIVARQRL